MDYWNRNPDDRLRRLERRAQSGDPSAWMQHYYELNRVGRLSELIDYHSDRIVNHITELNSMVEDQFDYRIEIDRVDGPFMATTPPPVDQLYAELRSTSRSLLTPSGVELDNNVDYYLSPEGNFGEVTWHYIQENILKRYLLLSRRQFKDRPLVTYAHIDTVNDDGEHELSHGLPNEALSWKVRRQIRDGELPYLPPPTYEHQPMLVFSLRIVGPNNIFRAALDLFYYLRGQTLYRRFKGDNYEQDRILPAIDRLLKDDYGYLDA